MSAAVILKTSYDYKWNVGVDDFLDYMDRPSAFKGKLEALKHDAYDYMNYMSDENKSDGLFTADKDVLTVEDVVKIRECERISQAEGCPKYLGVISFDNNFLRDNDLIIDNKLDTEKMRTITRKAIANMIEKSDKLQKDNCYWTAAIHLNTDNIHIHFQLLEYHRTEDRRATKIGKGQDNIEKVALECLKSTIASEVLNEKRTPMLTALMRDILIPDIGRNVIPTSSVVELLNKLPDTNKAWQYKRAKLAPFRHEIDECVNEIIKSNAEIKKSFDTFKSTLETMSAEYQKIYGSRENYKIKSYAEKQLEEFYARAGNTLLKELFEIKNDSSLNLSGGNDGISLEKPSEKKNPGLLKKKYAAAKSMIESEKSDDKDRADGLRIMKNLSSENPYARNYLAFYYYRHRKESEENEINSMRYLKKAFDEDKNMSACYLLGKQYLEQGNTKNGIDYIHLAADNGHKYAQYLYANITKNNHAAVKYALQAERQGFEPAKRISKARKNYPARTRVRFNASVMRFTRQAQIIDNRCAATIEHLLAESDAHLRQLQSEYEYEIMREQDEYIPYEREY